MGRHAQVIQLRITVFLLAVQIDAPEQMRSKYKKPAYTGFLLHAGEVYIPEPRNVPRG